MQHRGTARTRIVRVTLDGNKPEPGIDIVAGDKTVGSMGSSADGKGLALVRVDRVADALEAALPLTAGGITLQLVDADELAVAPKKTVA
jgi:folate-binding Fe-S cluster repair protein YgfZ